MACTAQLDAADANQHRDVYVRDLVAGKTTLVSRSAADDDATEPMISGDGSAVVYMSQATNLDPADLNPRSDVYQRVTPAAGPTALRQPPRRPRRRRRRRAVVLAVGVRRREHRRVRARMRRTCAPPRDANGHEDIYVRDIAAATTMLASAPDISDAATANGNSSYASISGQKTAGGQYYVAFTTYATNLGAVDANGDRDVYRRALGNQATALVSRAPGGVVVGGFSVGGGIDDSGTNVGVRVGARTSTRPTPVGDEEVYVRHMAAGTTELLSRAGTGGPAFARAAARLRVSGDGKAYAWHSEGGGGLPDATRITGTCSCATCTARRPRRSRSPVRPASEPFVNAGAARLARPLRPHRQRRRLPGRVRGAARRSGWAGVRA